MHPPATTLAAGSALRAIGQGNDFLVIFDLVQHIKEYIAGMPDLSSLSG